MNYTIEIRDKDNKLYLREDGHKVLKFTFDLKSENVESICKQTYLDYKAVCKEGSSINIEVRGFDSISETYSLLYSFYGENQRFIKH